MSLARIADRVLGMLSWGKVRSARSFGNNDPGHDSGVRRLYYDTVKVEAGGVADECQHLQPYGFLSRPLDGADAVVASMGSNTDQRIVILVADRRYTLSLEKGEVMLADDLGRRVHLARDGIIIEAPSIKLGATATLGVARAGDAVALSNTPGTSWAAQVTAAINALAGPGTVTASPTGTITAGSSKVRSA